ncbi:MAG: 16S rRNA (guanine(966)-N(2))-methyltransferase RsmD [Chloroflexota bacterium]|nr:MAG: 16S rRNA (guanine(966)-N(2))-methyltransferase RsmD [Chloroflexota bacterium]
MRISGGKVKGIRLKTLPKRSVRPTTSVVRQAIFSLLENRTTNWHRVLDLYAGSGTLGIEALSRGAEWVDFVDYRKSCCDLVRANLKKIGVMQRAHVYCCRVSKAVTFLERSYDIIFIDPPYSNSTASNLLGDLASSKLLDKNSTIVLCHANRFPLNSDYDGLHLIEQRRYGDTFIFIYQKEV